MYPDIPSYDTSPSSLILSDPLSEVTHKTRRFLLVVSSLGIIAGTFKLTIDSIPLTDTKFEDPSGIVASGAIGCLIIYFLIHFLVYLSQDVRGWLLSQEHVDLSRIIEPTTVTASHLRALHDDITSDSPHISPDQKTRIKNSLELLEKHLPRLIDTLVHSNLQARRLLITQWVRLLLLEFCLPIALSLFAMWKVSFALIPFLKAVVFGV